MAVVKKIGFVAIVAAGFGLILYAALSGVFKPAAPITGKLKVSASFYPLGEFARHVGGDKVDVTVLVKPGVEPHDYDPTPREMAGIHASKVLIYNGVGLEAWAEKIRGELQADGAVVVEASVGVTLLAKDASEAGESEASAYDPHVWLDPVLAAQQVDNIRAGFIQADPANRATYERNAEAYKRQLADLDAAYRVGLGECSRRVVVTAHQAFRYVGARYDLKMIGISGLSPDEEPSPQKLAEVARVAREQNVKYIFFETLASPKLAQTIAQEVGAQTLVLNPIEGLTEDEVREGKNYISVQRENLENLRIALDCK